MQACGSLLLTNQSTAKLSSDWLGGRYRREKIAWMIEIREPQLLVGQQHFATCVKVARMNSCSKKEDGNGGRLVATGQRK